MLKTPLERKNSVQVQTRQRGFMLQTTLLSRTAQLPALSASITELTSICVDENWRIEDACAVIDADPLLLDALLREANNGALSTSSRVKTSRDAVGRVGASQIMSVAIHVGLERLFCDLREYGEGALTTIRHCYRTAIAAETIKAASRVRLPHSFAATALLHDIGEIVLSHHLDETEGPSLQEIRQSHLGEAEAERSELDLDHCEVSALICRQWRLPQAIIQGVQHHHSPWILDNPLAYGVSLADQVATCTETPKHNNVANDFLLVGRCLGELGFSRAEMAILIDDTNRRIAERTETR